ncbi:MAG: hypothetical protein J0H94_19005 [Rhizobiales bacterium]|nr:hypothetical protein [Hyphomicrobiales bacterium]
MQGEECTLKDCVLEADGASVRMNVAGADGTPIGVRLSFEQLGSLAMTIPSLLERALRLRHSDASLRYVFPLGAWTVETAAETGALILSLDTPDGFKASFAVPPGMAEQMALALADQSSPPGDGRAGHLN